MPTPQLPGFSRDASAFVKWAKSIDSRFALFQEKLNNVLAGTGLSVPSQGTTQVDGSLVVQNGETKSGNYAAGSAGWHLDHNGNAEFNALTLRSGIIGNDALTNPTSPQGPYDYASNFAVPLTLTNLRTLTIPVPSGFTKAAVQLTVRIYAINNTAGLDYLYSQANINGYNGLALPVAASGSGGSCMNVSTFSAVLAGSTLGGNLVLQAAGQTAFAAWAANASNQLDISAMVEWYR